MGMLQGSTTSSDEIKKMTRQEKNESMLNCKESLEKLEKLLLDKYKIRSELEYLYQPSQLGIYMVLSDSQLQKLAEIKRANK